MNCKTLIEVVDASWVGTFCCLQKRYQETKAQYDDLCDRAQIEHDSGSVSLVTESRMDTAEQKLLICKIILNVELTDLDVSDARRRGLLPQVAA